MYSAELVLNQTRQT